MIAFTSAVGVVGAALAVAAGGLQFLVARFDKQNAKLDALAASVGDLAAIVRASSARVDELSSSQRDLTATVNSSSTRVDELFTRVDELSSSQRNLTATMNAGFAQVDELSSSQRNLTATMNAGFAQVDARFAQADARFERLSSVVTELADATVTASVAETVSRCATASTFFVHYTMNETTGDLKRCSAFAYQSTAAAPTVLLTASHCLPGRDVTESLYATRLGDETFYTCNVVVNLSDDDAAIIDCGHLFPIAGLGLAPRAGPVSSHVHVVAAGFVTDGYAGLTDRHLKGLLSTTALNLRYASTTDVVGPAANASSGVCVTSGLEASTLKRPAGFIDDVIFEGMSGGPVLDMRCRCLGIAHGHACKAAVFANLSAVDAYIARNMTAAA